MSITDYQVMQSLNITKLTLEQLDWLGHKLPDYYKYGKLCPFKGAHTTDIWELSLFHSYLAYNFNYSIMNSYDKSWDYNFSLL